jgi:hypothetical protein
VLRSLDSIAYAKAREGDNEKALQVRIPPLSKLVHQGVGLTPSSLVQLYRGILRSQDTRFGPTSKESMETTKLMGILHIKTDGFDEALDCFTTLLKWQKSHLANSDPDLQRTMEYIQKIESNLDGEVSVWI